MRTSNAASGLVGSLRGPNGNLPPPIMTRDQLGGATGKFCMTTTCFVHNSCRLGAQLDALNAHLGGVRNYVADGLVSIRRQALAAYLGVVEI